jgi:CheY-like chemotaxis protein
MMRELENNQSAVTMSARSLIGETNAPGLSLRMMPASNSDQQKTIRLPVSGPDGTSKNGRKILIVDDDAITCKVLSLKLKAEGYDVVAVNDGSEAIRAVRQHRPDAILMDINFPPDVGHGGGIAWDGFRLLNWMRSVEQAAQVPVVFITRADPAVYQPQLLASGAMGILQKPLDCARLLQMLAETLKDEAPGIQAAADI